MNPFTEDERAALAQMLHTGQVSGELDWRAALADKLQAEPDARADLTAGSVWEFDYTNHRGSEYRYVIDFAAGFRAGATAFAPTGVSQQAALAGTLISRDGDTRVDVRSRRRTFLLSGMSNVRVVA